MKPICPVFVGMVLVALLGTQSSVFGQEGWIDVLPPGISYKLKMPVEPRTTERTLTPNDETEFTLYQFLATVKGGAVSYVFSHNELVNPPINEKTLARSLDQAVQGSVVRLNGKLSNHDAIAFNRMQGRDFTYTFSDREDRKYKIRTKLFIHDGRMYELKVAAFAADFDENSAKTFFGSFKPTRRPNPAPKLETKGDEAKKK